MSDKFKVNISLEGDQAIVGLEGIMDEDMSLEKLESIKEGALIFDFSQIKSINSCGIRDWIAFISEKANGAKVVYRNCPKVIIEQMNMVKGFLPENCVIESFYAPFFCESCDHEENVLLVPAQVKGRKAPENIKCSQCGEEGMDFDALPQQYFHFLPEE